MDNAKNLERMGGRPIVMDLKFTPKQIERLKALKALLKADRENARRRRPDLRRPWTTASARKQRSGGH